MNAWKVILATLVIFITGVVTGGLLVGYGERASSKNRRFLSPRESGNRLPANANPSAAPFSREPRDSQRPPNLSNRVPRGLNMDFLQKLNAEVNLTPDQRERIEKIIADGQLRNKEIWEKVTPELRREMTETQKRIREELTPAQRARWEELMKQSRPQGHRSDEPMQPGMHPRDSRHPFPPRDGSSPDAPPAHKPENP